jgi:Uma2 family endonuclease
MTLPYGRPLTVADLADLPDDGRRQELIDGSLLVTPVPGWAHQAVVGALFALLHGTRPPGLRVVGGPFAFRPEDSTELRPDLVVTRFGDLLQSHLPVAPLLAVEVESPSTRRIDRMLKFAAYQDYGVASYWLVVPDPAAPTLSAYDLVDGRYVGVATVTGDEAFEATLPFPVTVVPARLATDLRPD